MDMTAIDVSHLIKDIAATASRVEKEGLVRKLAADPFGKFMIKWTYDPFTTFGIKPALYQTRDAPNMALRPTLIQGLLKRLVSRELSGNAAEREIYEVMAALDEDSAYLLFLILSKDLKCGIAEATINMAVPGLVPTFAVMRAQAYQESYIKGWPQKGEYKLDGNRNTFLCKDGKGAFFTRSGKVVPALDFLVPTVIETARIAVRISAALSAEMIDGDGQLSFMLDGEAMMGLFSETGKLRSKGTQATKAELHLYDFMSYADFDAIGSVGKPLSERRSLLAEFVAISVSRGIETLQIVPQFFVNSDAEVQALFDRALNKTLASYLARGDKEREAELLLTTIDKATDAPKMLEGVMIKKPDGLYEKRKSRLWLKLKADDTEDLRIIGFYPGEPHTKYKDCLGGVIVDRAGVEVRCGGGWSNLLREEVWRVLMSDVAALESVDPDCFDIRGGTKGTVWPLGDVPAHCGMLGRLIEVKFHEVTPGSSLRHPRFIRFRSDKEGEREAA